MHTEDNKFFEEYKHLEKLCSEIYGSKSGVSGYIAEMERCSSRGSRLISSWDKDYKMLKHVRHVRNKIAHESAAKRLSEPQDLEFVQSFRKRIAAEKDPLTICKTKAKRKPRRSPAHSKKSSKKSGLKLFVAICICILALVLLYFIYN